MNKQERLELISRTGFKDIYDLNEVWDDDLNDITISGYKLEDDSFIINYGGNRKSEFFKDLISLCRRYKLHSNNVSFAHQVLCFRFYIKDEKQFDELAKKFLAEGIILYNFTKMSILIMIEEEIRKLDESL